MAVPSTRAGRDFVMRHGETVYNRAGRMQGDHPHTPLTRAGFAQADAMGAAPKLTLWSSPAGRALQTLAIIAEHLELDWHQARTDARLVEIGMGAWSGRYYRELEAEVGPFVDRGQGLYTRPPEGGEWYDAIAARVSGWVEDTNADPGDRLVVMHGMSSRVLRGVMTGQAVLPGFDAPVAPALRQGSIALIEQGGETIVHRGTGAHETPT
ncbi:phosphoglycerate mutase [Sphingomonas sp. Leaf33]|uniref:histidine phosphatase family protein n=1 Tax=Sphingomonas sp. Leaf33 TaxID=1736215 RepID=UPI0006F54430|nr:histidine phosphatase family protein [Sphingomonas sp. Leaf33]KQN19576.1 phosphoglycerate mutase [Sphingomonas sp. Leaf33]